MKLRAVSLFAGCGASDYALYRAAEKAGIEVEVRAGGRFVGQSRARLQRESAASRGDRGGRKADDPRRPAAACMGTAVLLAFLSALSHTKEDR